MKRLTRIMCDMLRRHLAEGARPRVPDAGVIFWQAFAALSEARSIGAAGPEPIRLADLEAWARWHRVPFRPEHVAVIRALDAVWMEHARAAAGKGGGAAAALTPEGFDALV